MFRAGNDEAFRVIHDRYRQRLFAYTRQMLPGSRQDAEDALQDVFVRAYSSLRSNDRELALRAWLYRVAHNRCIDELRRPAPPAPEMLEFVRAPSHDPIAEAEQRESLRRLIEDVRRLPDQQRSALLMRELGGMSYFELADALGVSVPAVKSLLVRARVGLAAAQEARDTACSQIRDELILAHDRRVRPNATARRHIRDCAGCRDFRTEMRSVSRQLAALVPTLGPAAVIGKALGIGGGASGGAAAGGTAAAGGSAAVAGTGAVAASGVLATGTSHVATLLAAAVITAGGAVAIQSPPSHQSRHHARHHVKPAAKFHLPSAPAPAPTPAASPAPSSPSAIVQQRPAPRVEASSPPQPSAPPAGRPHTATPPHIPASADSVTLPSPSASSPADLSPTGGATRGTSGTGSASGSTTAGETSTTASTSGTRTPTSTTPGDGSTLSSTGQAGGSATPTPPGDSLPQTSSSTSPSTGAVPTADASSSSASGSSTGTTATTAMIGTTGTSGSSGH